MEQREFKRSPVWENEIEKEAKNVLTRLREDPVLLGVLMSKLLEERENTNRLLKTLLQKIERLESRATKNSEVQGAREAMLPEIDERIVGYLREKGKASAEDVRIQFNYKGTNAASARLNRLYAIGIIDKAQAGKRVYFFLPQWQGDQPPG
jgi:hypothetical protein